MSKEIRSLALTLRNYLDLQNYDDIRITNGCPAYLKEVVKPLKGYSRWLVYSSLTNLAECDGPYIRYPDLNESYLVRWFKEDTSRVKYINSFLSSIKYPTKKYYSFYAILLNGMFVEYVEVFDKIRQLLVTQVESQKEKEKDKPKPKPEPVATQKMKITKDPFFDIVFGQSPLFSWDTTTTTYRTV